MDKVDIIEYQNLSEPVRVTVVTGLLNIPDTGVPKGGKKGQNLTKKSDSDFDTYWADPDDINSIERITLNGEEVPVEDKTAKITVDKSTLGLENIYAELNENIIKNPEKNYAIFKGNFASTTSYIDSVTIDWGDGSTETIAAGSKFSHTYTDGIAYHIITTEPTLINFSGKEGLIKLSLGNKNTYVGGYFNNCPELISVILPDSGMTALNGPAELFTGCTKLKSIEIGSNIKTIGPATFYDSGIEYIYIKKEDAVINADSSIFASANALKKVIVPKNLINEYKAAQGWSTVADKIVYEIDSSDLDSAITDLDKEHIAYVNKENTFTERQKFKILSNPEDPEDNTWYHGYIDASAVNVSKDVSGYGTDEDATLTPRSLKLTRRINAESGSTQYRIQLDLDGIKRVEYVNHVLANYGYIFPKTYPNQNVTLATIEDLTAQFGSLNIQNGTGISSIQQNADPKYNGVIKAATKNPYAKVLYPELTDAEPIGAIGDYAASFGGNSSVQAKRGIGGGTSSVTKGPYSQSLGDNTVTTPKASDSTAIGYQTTTDAPGAFTHGSYTVVMSQKYIEGMFDPSVEPGQGGSGQPTEPGTTPTDTLEMDSRRGEAASAGGFNSYSSGFAAEVDGVSNVADGHISKSSGRSNRSWSYLSKTDGKNSVVKPDQTNENATGEGSWANGDNIQIIGAKYAYSGGSNNIVFAGADNSFSYGEGLQVKHKNQVVLGQYNDSNNNDLFVFGVGTGNSDRKNALRVSNEGKFYYGDFEVSNLKTTNDAVASLDNKLSPKITGNTTEITNLWKTLRDTNTNLNKLNETKYDKTGGTIGGNVIITGDLTVNGTQHINNTENLNVENAMIYSNAKGATLATNGGIGIKKNATDVYAIVYDPVSDSVKLGLGKSDANGVFTFNANEGQPVAIRDDSSKFNANHFIKWNEEQKKLVDSGYLAEDFVDVATQQTIAGMKTFTDEVHFGTTHFNKDLNVDNAAVKIFDNLKDLVTRYKADSIVIDNGTGSSAVQHVLTLPKETGTLLLNKFKYSTFGSSNDGDSWNLTDGTKNLEIKYQDANSHSSIFLEKDYIELSDINGTGSAKVSLASNVITLDTVDSSDKHKIIRINPDKVSIGNSTDTPLVEIDSLSAKFSNRPQVKDNGNYVDVALKSDLDNYVPTQSESADKYYAQITNENGIISARIFQNGGEDVQNLIISKDGVKVLGKNVANTEQVDGKVDKLPASLRNQAYVRDKDGNDTGLAYAYTDEGGTLAVRNASGQLQVSDPSQDKDATNKSYADNLNARYVSTSILGG